MQHVSFNKKGFCAISVFCCHYQVYTLKCVNCVPAIYSALLEHIVMPLKGPVALNPVWLNPASWRNVMWLMARWQMHFYVLIYYVDRLVRLCKFVHLYRYPHTVGTNVVQFS